MGHGHRSVTHFGIAAQEYAHGHSHDVATAYDKGIFAGRTESEMLKKKNNTVWRRGQVGRQSKNHKPHIFGMKAIHILDRINGEKYLVGIDVLGQGKLHDETVYARIQIERVHLLEQILLAAVSRKLNEG